jgi:tRNA1Val (adenine37-N6)-methyltransferase
MPDDRTYDTFFNGRISVVQESRGYRFSIDAVILAGLLELEESERVIDLGTGCGIVPLILAQRQPHLTIYGVEVQGDLASLAEENVTRNGMRQRINIIENDMRLVLPAMVGGPVDVVICNPPYRSVESGRINPNRQRAVARHEIKVTLEQVIQSARRLLRTAGRFCCIYPAERLADMLIGLRRHRIEPKHLRFIQSDTQSEARLFMVVGTVLGRPGLLVSRPLVIYEPDGRYTNEMKSLFDL